MLSYFIADEVQHWRKRAEEMRTLAGDGRNSKEKAIMLKIAKDYEQWAKISEERRGPLSGPSEPITPIWDGY